MSIETKKMYSNLIIKNGNDNTILFLKRSGNNQVSPDQWCLPGGHVEPFEEPQDAATREAFEEVGFDFRGREVPAYLKTIITDTAVCFYYDVYINDPTAYGVLKLDQWEHDNYIWLTLVQALEKLDLMMNLGDHLKEIFFNTRPQPVF